MPIRAGFVEIANLDGAAADLTRLALVLINGDGTEYGRVALTGTLAAAATSGSTSTRRTVRPTGSPSTTPTSGSLLDALSYEGPITHGDDQRRTRSISSKARSLPATVADSNTANGSLIRSSRTRSDTNNAAVDWVFTTTPTPGAANVLTP